MNKKYSDKEVFHYINPIYDPKTKGNYHKTNNPSSDSEKNNRSINNNNYESINKTNTQDSQYIPKNNTNFENEFAFRGNCEVFKKYNYVPYYEKKNNSKN